MLMRFLYVFWDFLLISSEWIVISLILSGIIHAFVRPQVLQKSIGNKKISCVTDYERAHKNNSIRHRYLKGVYQGVPEIGYLDFKELVDDAMEQVKINLGATDVQDEK